MRVLTIIPILFLLLLLSCSTEDSQDSIHTLFDEEWAFRMQENPLFATNAGHHQYNDRLPSVTEADQKRRYEYYSDLMERLEAIDRSSLSETDRINYDIFERQIWENIENYKFKAYLVPFTADDGFHISFARIPNQVPLATVSDYENYIKRLNAFPSYVDQYLGLLRKGIESGITMPGIVLQGYEITIETHIVDEPTTSVFYKPFEKIPSTVAASERERLEEIGKKAVIDGVVKGYSTLLNFMVNEYIPNARTSIGASELPNGRQYYAQRVKYFTTLDMSVDEIHQLGLQEVKRIRSEMEQIIKKVGFSGSFADFLKFLRTDPQFYAKTPEELLKQASYIAKQMDAKLPSLFKTMPRLPYGVAPVPDHLAPKYTTGRYVGAALGSTQPGYYWVNTYALDRRPLYTLEALTFHEAVPGHHLQNALARELQGLPNFRRFSYISAFGEGWGLYCEWLAKEVGFYTDPYNEFGRLTYEMWRACRLVVDTGMHAMGWTRKQAMDYLGSNTALSLHNVRTETDRYISWPGQALAYKIGELKIRELRKKVEEGLGGKFDIREFHDVVLLNGAIPLTTLENLVQGYIQKHTATN